MGKNKKILVEIVQMHEFFLYLPLYVAEKFYFEEFIPAEYVIKVISSKYKTDDSAYDMLMGTARAYKNVMFAVCDPMIILKDVSTPKNRNPIVLASLITNYSFWAINHQRHNVTLLKDLAKFDKIICYREGTTSYNIARRIYSDGGIGKKIADFIYPVETGQELIAFANAAAGSIVLSPDLLGIDALLGEDDDNKYSEELAIGDTAEYSGALVTALMSRLEVYKDHPKLVSGLLNALQHAILLVRSKDQKVIAFAHDQLGNGEYSEGALSRAIDHNVFPESIEVKYAHWEKAVKATYTEWSEYLLKDALGKYEQYVKPYANNAIEIFNACFSNNRKQPTISSVEHSWIERNLFSSLWLSVLIIFNILNYNDWNSLVNIGEMTHTIMISLFSCITILLDSIFARLSDVYDHKPFNFMRYIYMSLITLSIDITVFIIFHYLYKRPNILWTSWLGVTGLIAIILTLCNTYHSTITNAYNKKIN
ncbi:MAG: hypothetical protein HQK99_17505 [Nitrospirae bacterium]|nr:hypothetical protein [Nitrospirota bacterium]